MSKHPLSWNLVQFVLNCDRSTVKHALPAEYQWRSQRGGTGGPGPPRNAHQKNSEVPVYMSCGLDTVAGKIIFSYPPSYSSVRTPAAGCRLQQLDIADDIKEVVALYKSDLGPESGKKTNCIS